MTLRLLNGPSANLLFGGGGKLLALEQRSHHELRDVRGRRITLDARASFFDSFFNGRRQNIFGFGDQSLVLSVGSDRRVNRG